MNDDVLLRRIVGNACEGVGTARHIRLGVLCAVNMSADAGGTESGSDIDPLIARSHSLCTFGCIKGILAMAAIHSDVYNCGTRLLHRAAKLIQILRIRRWEDRAPRLNMMHVELCRDVGRKVLEFYLLRCGNRAGGLAIPAFPAHDELAERIRSDGDAIASSRRKFYRWTGLCMR